MFDVLTLSPFFAQAAPGGGIGQILFMLAAFGGIVYFLIWRPQQQQRKKHEEMLAALKRGDQVILQGGLYGKIKTIHEDTLEIEIAPDVVVRQVRSMILSVPAKPEPEIKKPAAKKAPAKRTAAKKPSETAKAPAKRASKAKSDDA